jgi:hypothetical protein
MGSCVLMGCEGLAIGTCLGPKRRPRWVYGAGCLCVVGESCFWRGSVAPRLRGAALREPRALVFVCSRLASCGGDWVSPPAGRHGTRDDDLLLMDRLVERVQVAIQLEQIIQLRHEVQRYGAAGHGQRERELC